MELQVMILDDEYIILDGLCSFPWSDYGYRISATARNGLEGLEKLEQAKPDLILTDVKMPGMDGLDFAEKAHEIYPNICGKYHRGAADHQRSHYEKCHEYRSYFFDHFHMRHPA